MTKNILIIGNGFDLYHKLPTRYKDFMFLVSEWDYFYKEYLINAGASGKQDQIIVRLTEKGELTREALNDFAKHCYLMNDDHVQFLNQHINSNTWIQCFKAINKELQWIDFEEEIQSVLNDVEEYSLETIPNCAGKMTIEVLPARLARISEIFGMAADGYMAFEDFEIQGPYYDKEELQKNKRILIDFMIKELDCMIKCLQYYLIDFVGNIKCKDYSKQVTDLGKVDVLNFNYTDTFIRVYGEEKIGAYHSVHGNARSGNIVLGVSDDAFGKNYDYIRFQKYFQRIQKRTGSWYKNWIDFYYEKEEAIPKQVYVFGHSLGAADFGVLKEFFLDKAIHQTKILYHKDSSYEDLVINLVKSLGKDFVIESIGNGRIAFEVLKKAEVNNSK